MNKEEMPPKQSFMCRASTQHISFVLPDFDYCRSRKMTRLILSFTLWMLLSEDVMSQPVFFLINLLS